MSTSLTPEIMARLDALAEAATAGPWYWRNTQDVYLFGDRSRVVMAFGRMGMQRAQPVFRDHATNLLVDAGKANINAFPDAAFIAESRTALPALVAEVRRLREGIEALIVTLGGWGGADADPLADDLRALLEDR